MLALVNNGSTRVARAVFAALVLGVWGCGGPTIVAQDAAPVGSKDGGGSGGRGGDDQPGSDARLIFPDLGPSADRPPEPDVAPIILCSNGVIDSPEMCDDGNLEDGDGCSGLCTREPNYVCPTPGMPCKSTVVCGDGKVTGLEGCDDGNTKDGDGCSASCSLEPAPIDDITGNGWACAAAGTSCARTMCGNKIVEGSEQCDDGNNNTGDGCSPLCRKEPVCPAGGGACSTACGDGLLLPIDLAAGQECDDGNTVSGDGCSKDCKVEMGFQCTSVATMPSTLLLPIVIRDVNPKGSPNGHPDFEAYNGDGDPGIVLDMLGADGKPHHVPTSKVDTVNNDNNFRDKDYFALWWNDDAAYNKTIRQFLPMTSPSPGVYAYINGEFYPIDNMGWGNTNKDFDHNYNFADEVRSWFEYQGNELLDFTGDDDLWVFINKKLALDLGGLHEQLSGSVKLDAADGTATVCDLVAPECATPRKIDLGLKRGSVYEIAVFHAERHTDASNYKLTLTGFGGSRSNCTPVKLCGDGTRTGAEQCDLGTGNEAGPYGKGKCSKTCTLAPYCGDGRTQREFGEECDGGPYCTDKCKPRIVD
jgi:fibro-slime domain-containing protein